jgi:hypothetical protein
MINDITLKRTKLNGSIFLDIKPVKNLVWHSVLGFDISGTKGDTFNPTYSFGTSFNDHNTILTSKNDNSFWQLINNVTYSGKYKKHSYTAMLGEDIWESSYNNLQVQGSDLPSNDVHNIHWATNITQPISAGFGSTSMASFFTRETYNYDERYLGTFTYRRDGSSNFGPLNRWANFFSFAASWRFSNEAFLKDQTTLSNGKLRLGWGQTGNSSIGGYKWGASISSMPTGLGPGYRQGNIANPYIHWETQKQWNLGLDLGFIKDRINLTIDADDKTSSDMLMQASYPTYIGTGGAGIGNPSGSLASPWGNYGTINNKGLEFSLNTQNIKGAFEWTTDVQLSFNKNKLVALPEGMTALLGYPQWGGQGSPITYTKVGDPLYNFYGYVTDGYYKDKADIENSPKPAAYKGTDGYNRYNTIWVGDIKFKDISGPDGKPDEIGRAHV